MTNIEIAQLISERIGQSPIPHNDIRNISYEIYQELGGESELEDFEDIYELLLTILPMAQIIDDTSIRTDKTWSSSKINSELSDHYTKTETDTLLGEKQDMLTAGNNISINENNVISANDTTYTAGDNITIDENNVISANDTVYSAGNNISINENNVISANDTTYSAGNNIDITDDTISAKGYKFNGDTNGGFAEQYKQRPGDGGQIVYNTAIGLGSHAEGYGTSTSGNYGCHAEGNGTKATGYITHTEGLYTQAQNYVEHTQGSFNNSHKTASNAASTWQGDGNHTLHSIGIGTDNNARKNVIEVMQNGETYLYGVGGYDGIHIKGETGAPSGLQTLQEAVNGKQNVLTAGDNIDITNNVIATLGYVYNATYNSITTGTACNAEGEFSHAEGESCMTSTDAVDSHAEGVGTTANGLASHAEGDSTTANGSHSHTEGEYCVTDTYAVASHAEGVGTQATNEAEHAQGRYNVSHSVDVNETQHEGNTIVSVGIGLDDDQRKNAFEIMQNGDIYLYGLGNYDGTLTKYDDSAIMTLQDILKKIADETGVDIGALF